MVKRELEEIVGIHSLPKMLSEIQSRKVILPLNNSSEKLKFNIQLERSEHELPPTDYSGVRVGIQGFSLSYPDGKTVQVSSEALYDGLVESLTSGNKPLAIIDETRPETSNSWDIRAKLDSYFRRKLQEEMNDIDKGLKVEVLEHREGGEFINSVSPTAPYHICQFAARSVDGYLLDSRVVGHFLPKGQEYAEEYLRVASFLDKMNKQTVVFTLGKGDFTVLPILESVKIK